MSELDDAARWLEAVTHDPMAGAVRGTVTTVSVSEPEGRARHQTCRVTLRVAAPGIETHDVDTEFVFPVKRWPTTGLVLPALVSPSDPNVLEVDWENLPR